MIVITILLCLASAVLGRLLLTREQAWRTITVRIPAIAMLLLSIFACCTASVIFAALCFIGGSFYGLYNWWLPTLESWFDGVQYPLNAIGTGRWSA